jgi:probable HAF family extracellular repeat protein
MNGSKSVVALMAVVCMGGIARAAPSFQGLGDLPGGTFQSAAPAVSDDGTVVVGEGRSALGREAYRWQGGVMTPLGDLSGG